MKTDKELLDEYHTEIMVQTSRGCPGANFTEANRLYLELSSRLTKGAADLPRACARGNHYTSDERGRSFDFCPDCGNPLT